MEKESLLTIVSEGVKDILVESSNKNVNKDVFETNVKTLIDNGHGEDLYNKIIDVISEHLEVVKGNVLTNMNEILFLQRFCYGVFNYDLAIFWIRAKLLYMETAYIMKEGLLTLNTLGKILYRDIVFYCVKDRIRDILLDMIMAARKGETVRREDIRTAILMLVKFGVGTLSVYEEVFEKIYLHQANEYYNNLRLTLLGENEADEYVRKIEACINKEMEIVKDCLEISTLAKLRIVLKKDLSYFFKGKAQYPYQ